MVHVAETGSTNADLLALAQGGVADGTWLRADVQSGGRGRLGRAWASPPGNLYASTIVRVLAGDPPAATLALVAAVALEEAVSAYLRANDDVKLKWPNDLIVGGKKLSGILLERADDAVVIGFGVNLAAHPALPDRPTTSLASHGIELSPEALLETLAEALARWLSRWRSEGLGPIRARWVARAHPTGSALSVRQPDGTTLEGLFDGLDQSGALMLRLADGSRHVMHAGDVFLLD
ncbi:biotin--[acetyl-CoA-carboxylase] ligase [Sphingomonas japonica]|uniref:biotin--[acetyl-CoA-carboxylase] ligase n=1 Tax=Sphingomonas japonica TaxID=511662 RepID=UPI00111F1631|nr:biotin--[acetyl-CoA-carboxylase] ligase [Sphingomonas japonica]